MPLASSTAGRSRPTIQLGNAIGSSASPREKDSPHRLLARRLRLPSSPPVQQSAQSKMITLKSMAFTLSSPALPVTHTAGVSSTEKCTQSPQLL